jgi:hypothetical protein
MIAGRISELAQLLKGLRWSQVRRGREIYITNFNTRRMNGRG